MSGSRRGGFGGGFAAGAFAILLGAAVADAGRTGEDDEVLPPGPGREAVVAACHDCHPMERVVAKRHTRIGWQGIVDQMVGLGAPGSFQEMTEATDYLTWRFGYVNVNRASQKDLQEVLGLSAVEADALVEFRTHEGDLTSLDDLKDVPGLDFAKIEASADRILFKGER